MHLLRHFSFFPRLAILSSVSLLCLPAGDGLAGIYRDSAHGGSNGTGGVVRPTLSTAYAAGNCAHCHEQHASINGVEPVPNLPPGPSSNLLFADMAGNAMCNYCHDGSVALPVDNIASQISKPYSHDPNYVTSPALCSNCHDPHVAQHTNHIEASGGNLVGVGSPLLSVAGSSATNWFAGIPGPGAEALGGVTLAAVKPITMEYQLCFKCHADPTNTIPANLNVYLQFNSSNYSVHPVATEANPTWKNAWLKGPGFPAAWKGNWAGNLNARMYCSDCHGSETVGDPEGPHGSTQPYLLKYAGPALGVLDNLCLHCHNPLASSAWVDPPGNPQPLMIGDHTLPQHQYPANPQGCLACHGGIGGALASNIHGANYRWADYLNNPGFPGRPSNEFLVGGLITQNYYIGTDTRGNRRCASSCHTSDGGAGYTY